MKKFKNEDLVFLPLGGSNEIGMNVNLYHYQGKWLIVDLGAGFADSYFPGVQMLAPDLSFIYHNLKDFVGIVLTHAHEDHVGSVGYLWDKLRLPIWATPFTAGIAKAKLQEMGVADKAVINEVKPGSKFDVGPFKLEMIELTHSIPEMNSVVIRTDYGNILHTGDWKLDPDPVVGPVSNETALKALGDEGVLAMVCDSTNVFNDRHSGSEGALKDSVSKLIAGQKGLVVVTTFASNVARVDTLVRAAKEQGRRVAITGWSLRRISSIAQDCGYLQDVEFLTDNEIAKHPRDKMMVICTGCQGEPNAAMNKIAAGMHPTIRLLPKDLIIFSSKIIPGNEKKIFRLFNKFVRLGVDVLTEKDHFVHVSGHPSRDELTRMYELVRPQIAIPVHGEPMHLHEHVKLAKSIGIPKQVEIQNGEAVRLAPGEIAAVANAPFGYLGVDGKLFHNGDGEVMKMRRRLQNDGIIIVSLVLNMNGSIAIEPKIIAPGVIDEKENRQLLREIADELIEVVEAQRDSSDDNIYKSVRSTMRRIFNEITGKTPPVEILISRI